MRAWIIEGDFPLSFYEQKTYTTRIDAAKAAHQEHITEPYEIKQVEILTLDELTAKLREAFRAGWIESVPTHMIDDSEQGREIQQAIEDLVEKKFASWQRSKGE